MEFLRYMDLFGTTCKFYIEGQQKFWTIYGGILSIISIILFIYLFFFLNQEDFKREIPETSTSSIPEISYRKINFDKEKIWLPWRLVDDNFKNVNFSNVLYPKIILKTIIKQNDGNIDIINKEISYKLCSNTTMTNSDKHKFLINENLNELYCLDVGSSDIGGSWKDGNLSIIQFELYRCKNGIEYNESNENCSSFEKIANITGPNNSLILEILYPVVQFQPANITNPAVVIYKENYYLISKWTNSKNRVYLQEYVIRDDLGLIYSKPINYSYWGVSSMRGNDYFSSGEKDIINEGSNSRIYSFDVYVDTGITYSTRKYKKLLKIIIDSLPILTVISSLFKKLTKLFKESSTQKKVTELLFEKLIRKTNRSYLTMYMSHSYRKTKKNSVQVNNFLENDLTNKNHESIIRNKLNSQYKKNEASTSKIDNNSNFLMNNNYLREENLENNNGKENSCFQRVVNNTPKKNIDPNINYYRDKVLFPFRYYFFSVTFKNLSNKKLVSRKFSEVNNYISYVFDVSTYISLKKDFDYLVKSLINKKIIDSYKPGRIDINTKTFYRDIDDILRKGSEDI